ncbi:MAG: ATP synthase F1 subunit gamma [Tissierellia bacterium]|nr:ATP synthase F1 subunit gamma [Tissierellia bacterium]
MASTREIKRRIRGINNIRQITKAMELVSTAKLRKARSQLERSRPYYSTVLDDIGEILAITGGVHPLLKEREVKTVLYIVLTSDRGLAGGYNSNVIRLATETASKSPAASKFMVIGNKAKEHFQRRGYDIVKSFTGISENPNYVVAQELANLALDLYRQGEADAIEVIYTEFESTLSYKPKVIRLLPDDAIEAKEGGASSVVEFEPSPEEVLDYLIPKYVASTIFGALIESAASEQGSRRVSMEAATDNANEMITELETNFNRARQAAITGEITEIVASADAIQ